jgi:hypothetical protein
MKALPQELSDKIDEVNQWLFYGDIDKVAKLARKSRVTVYKVLDKKAFNASVIEKAIEVMNSNKVRFEISPSMKVA